MTESDESEPVPLVMDGVLDLHGFSPRDVGDLVPIWLDECQRLSLRELRIVHGKGRGVLRRTVHAILARRADVLRFALADQTHGGWGATIVWLKPNPV